MNANYAATSSMLTSGYNSTINMMVKQVAGGGMQLSRIPIPPIPDHLKQVIEEQKS